MAQRNVRRGTSRFEGLKHFARCGDKETTFEDRQAVIRITSANNSEMPDQKQKAARSKKRMIIEWSSLILIVLFIRYTDQGTVVQGWLQQGILATGFFQADVTYAEENDIPASYELSLVTLDGRPENLENFRGKTIFLNLWATWCAPCLAEMPYIESLYQDVKDENIEIVAISTDDQVEVARRFIEAKGYTFPVYRVVGQMPQQYASRSLPSTYVISPDGKMATVHFGMANYNTRGFKSFLRGMSETTLP